MLRLVDEEDPEIEVLVCRVHERVFMPISNWTIEKHSMAYSEGIARAVRVWAGDTQASQCIRQVSSAKELEAVCDPFDGGDTGTELFSPKRTSRRASLIRLQQQLAQQSAVGLGAKLRSKSAPPAKHPQKQGTAANAAKRATAASPPPAAQQQL